MDRPTGVDRYGLLGSGDPEIAAAISCYALVPTGADVASPEFHPLVRQSKDAAAGAVLIAATGAVVIGILVLGPRVLDLV